MADKVTSDTRANQYPEVQVDGYTSPKPLNRFSSSPFEPQAQVNDPYGSSSRNYQALPFEKNLSLKIDQGRSSTIFQPASRRVETQGDEEENPYNRFSNLGLPLNQRNSTASKYAYYKIHLREDSGTVEQALKKLQAAESLSRGSSSKMLLNLPSKTGYALNDFDDNYSVSDAAGRSNASTQRQRKNHIKVSVLMPSLQIMQEMEEDNLQYTSRSRRLTNTARFHSGQSQEATTPAGKTMIEDDSNFRTNP